MITQSASLITSSQSITSPPSAPNAPWFYQLVHVKHLTNIMSAKLPVHFSHLIKVSLTHSNLLFELFFSSNFLPVNFFALVKLLVNNSLPSFLAIFVQFFWRKQIAKNISFWNLDVRTNLIFWAHFELWENWAHSEWDASIWRLLRRSRYQSSICPNAIGSHASNWPLLLICNPLIILSELFGISISKRNF